MEKAAIRPIRRLSYKDCFQLAELIGKLNLKEDLKNIVKKTDGNARAAGIEVLAELIEKAPDVQEPLAAFLAEICGTDAETVGNAPIAEESDLAAFFTSAQS